MTAYPGSDIPTPERVASNAVVQVDGVRKHFGKTTAVAGISFAVQQGETFGLLGPNGAGKTTTMKMLSGLLRPDSGSISIDGIDVSRAPQKAQRLLGIVPQGIALYEEMSVQQNLQFFARLKGVSRREEPDHLAEILKVVGLADDAARRVKSLSGGMKRRLNIGIGLLGRPKVLLLDEPTVGVDPQSRRHILDSVKGLADEGVTIIYSSHYMEEVEYLCRRVAIMDHGHVIAQGPLSEVRALAGDSVVVRVPRPGSSEPSLDADLLRETIRVPLEMRSDEFRFILPKGSSQVPDVLAALVRLNIPLDGMTVESPNLETVFLSLTGKALRDPSGEGNAQ